MIPTRKNNYDRTFGWGPVNLSSSRASTDSTHRRTRNDYVLPLPNGGDNFIKQLPVLLIHILFCEYGELAEKLNNLLGALSLLIVMISIILDFTEEFSIGDRSISKGV